MDSDIMLLNTDTKSNSVVENDFNIAQFHSDLLEMVPKGSFRVMLLVNH